MCEYRSDQNHDRNWVPPLIDPTPGYVQPAGEWFAMVFGISAAIGGLFLLGYILFGC